ncbi:ribosomal L1 domain-containing protein 1 [Talpa occidentalis]|uniref:ribosomal L1 domain-containing protein 1 n=1 Tax=Talpa occidentalis TaxID=50954 RepID=UPI00188E0E85|nr:ribosomal L1 domain-containing protein 1 [Talpa occidentalis]
MEAAASTAPAASTAAAASTPEAPTALEQLDEEQIKKAVEVLLTHTKSRKNANGLLLNENENFFLMVVLWKIPSKELRVRLSLPHGIRSDLADVCLFTKDEPDSTPEKTESFYRKLLNKHGIKTVSQIIPFRTLKTEYKAYEAKRRLLASFDFFLTDARIRRLLPTHLGRHFYHRKKFPVPVNLLAKNLSKEINESIGGTVLNISKSGSCSAIRIGHTGMPAQHVIKNILAVAKGLAQKLPEKWESVKLLYVKTERSVSLPIFSSFVSVQGEAKGVRTPSQKKKEARKQQRRKEYLQKKRLMKEAAAAPSALTKAEVTPKTNGTPAKGPKPQKAETPKHDKKKKGKGKAVVKVQDESEDEIPLLVPIGKPPAKENGQIQKQDTGKKSQKKSPGPNTPRGKKRKAVPASDTPKAEEPKTPGKGPGKKPRIKEEAGKERNLPMGKKDPRQTPKKPEAKFFTTPNKSAKKAQTPKQSTKKPKVPQSA